MWSKFRYSFPVQLLVLHGKKNQLLLLFWAILFGVVWQDVGRLWGIPYLFLDPEYMNQVSFWGLFIMGVSVGGLTMAFHITCYILDAHRFGFLGNEKSPFNKFCVNNSVLPLAFLIIYLISFIRFQTENENCNILFVATEALALVLGFGLMVMVLFYYFVSTNKDIFKVLAGSLNNQIRGKKRRISRVNVLKKVDQVRRNRIRVDYFFTARLRWQKANNQLIDLSAALKVLKQNHLNAFIIQCFVFASVIILGVFRERAIFQIPAGASIILLFTLAVLLMGALHYWMRGWVISLLILLIFVFNFLIKENIIQSSYEAFGLDYTSQKADYSLDRIKKLSSDSIYKHDVASSLQILENWRKKFPAHHKPKMVFVCVSGGGQRAALWTMRSLQTIDSTLNGELMKHTFLMTGASGGLVGASYFRELYLQKQKNASINIYGNSYLNNIGKDNLNPIVFTLVVNDLFLRFQKFDYQGFTYHKDRGYAFEQQLNKNTEGLLNKTISEYKQPEREGLIPMLIMSPTIVNDGRKLYISPQHISYMTVPTLTIDGRLNQKVKGIEFLRFFNDQHSQKLSFLSALRMNATFPYITPTVTLPSEPAMEIMDAGLSDNYGISDATRFLYVFKDWISNNTAGVIFLSIRDTPKDRPTEKNTQSSLFQKVFTPIGSLYNNWEYLQDLQNDNSLEFTHTWFDGKVYPIDVAYAPESRESIYIERTAKEKRDSAVFRRQERAALSWHLTAKEKESLKRTINESCNQEAIQRLKQLLQD